MTAKEIFSQRLKTLREEYGLSQTELAEKIGVSRGSISFYENGDRVPDIEVLERIQKYFGVDFNYLLGYSRCEDYKNEDVSKRFCLSETAIKQMEQFTKYAAKKSGELLSDVFNAILTDSKAMELLKLSLNYILIYTGEDPNYANDRIKAITQDEAANIELIKGANARFVSEKYAEILLDIVAKGKLETYYDIERTKDGWIAKTKGPIQNE